jgi:hypothetical protein
VLELVMWVIVEGLMAAGVFLLVRRVVRAIRHERWARRSCRQQRLDGTRERLTRMRSDWDRRGAVHAAGEEEW